MEKNDTTTVPSELAFVKKEVVEGLMNGSFEKQIEQVMNIINERKHKVSEDQGENIAVIATFPGYALVASDKAKIYRVGIDLDKGDITDVNPVDISVMSSSDITNEVNASIDKMIDAKLEGKEVADDDIRNTIQMLHMSDVRSE